MNRQSRRHGTTIRRALERRWRGHEDGITMAIFAVALLVLLGMVALGIDGSRIYDERREAQNAADHAAIAAAFASCTSTSTDNAVLAAAAQTAGLASAAQNGYDDVPSNEVTINVESTTEHRYEALIDTSIPTTFGQVLGFSQLDTHGEATAEATGCDESGGSVPAIHAGGTNCPGGSLNNVQISGNDHNVNGLTQTNGNFYMSGSNNDFLNPGQPSVRYRGTFTGGGGSNTYNGTQVDFGPTTIEPWPSGWDPIANMTDPMWNAYRAVRVNASATASSFNITANGVYYTERAASSGSITVNSISNNAQFVVVSKFAPIIVPNSHTGRTYHAYASNPAGTPANAMFISGFSHSQPCDQFAFEKSGEGGTWNGVFWTPRAMSRWSGNLSTINGGFVTWAFQMNGNQHTINGGNGQGAAVPDVVMIE